MLLLFVIIGCNSQTPTGVLTPFASSPKPILTASPMVTLTPSLTLNPYKATEKAQFEYYQQTQVHIKQTMIPGTLEARGTQCKDGFYLEQYLVAYSEMSDEWTLFTCSPSAKNNERWTPGLVDYGTRYTQVVKKDLSKIWTITHGDYENLVHDRPDVFMRVYRWTQNGNYLYLYARSFPAPSGYQQSSMLRTLINNLYRLNLITGEFELVIAKNQFDAFALSPNDQFLVYSENKKPYIVHVKNMETGNEQSIKLDEEITVAGSFVWNAESTKIVFALGYGEESNNWQDDLSATSILVLTIENMNAQTILSKDSRMFIPSSDICTDGYWVDDDTICLMSLNDELIGWDSIFCINLQSGELKTILPTQTPIETNEGG